MQKQFIYTSNEETFRREINSFSSPLFFNKNKIIFSIQLNSIDSIELDNTCSSRDYFSVFLSKIPSFFKVCYIHGKYSSSDLFNLKESNQSIIVEYPSSLSYLQLILLKQFIKKTFPSSEKAFSNGGNFLGILHNSVSFKIIEDVKPLSFKELKKIKLYFSEVPSFNSFINVFSKKNFIYAS